MTVALHEHLAFSPSTLGKVAGLFPSAPTQMALTALQLPPQEIGTGVVRMEPRAVAQEAVYFVRNDELFEVHSLPSQRTHQLNRLREVHVAVIVAMYQKHRRFPCPYGRHRRGFKRGARRVITGRTRRACARPAAPVMHAVEIHARREQVGSSRQS